MADHDAAIDALYAVPLTGFVSARKALAKELRDGGDREAAKAVDALKKPSLVAWTLNQLVRRERERVEGVLTSLDEQRDLQLGALDGSLDPKALRAARDEERAHTAALVAAAEAILEEGGQAGSKGNVDRVAKALRAVALSPSSREQLLAGRLVDDAPAGGFEAAAEQLDPALLLAALSAKPKPAKKTRRSGDGLFARSTRSHLETAGTAPAKDASEAERAREEEAREQAEALARDRQRKARLAEAQAKLAALRLERQERQAAVDASVARAEQLQKEVDAARGEARKSKRLLADLDERIRRLEKRIDDA